MCYVHIAKKSETLNSSSGWLKGRSSIEMPRSWASCGEREEESISDFQKIKIPLRKPLKQVQISTLALCNVVHVISIFVALLIFPKGSSSFVKRSNCLSAVFADLR